MQWKAFVALVLVMMLVTPWCARADTHNDNVVILLDGSGSMHHEMRGAHVVKLDAAKTALKQLLTHVPENINVGLLVFGRVEVPWVYPLGPRDDAKLTAAIDGIPCVDRAGTPLGAFIKKAADRLLEERAKDGGCNTYRLVIVTDGEADDQPDVERFTPEVIARGIVIDVIGVDMKTDHTLAKKVHSYRRADDPASLEKALAEVFAEVSDGGGAAGKAEDFDLIQSIPAEIAQAMLTALAKQNNNPIGAGK